MVLQNGFNQAIDLAAETLSNVKFIQVRTISCRLGHIERANDRVLTLKRLVS